MKCKTYAVPLVVFFVFWLNCTPSIAQNYDSLYEAILDEYISVDSTRVNRLNRLAYEVRNSQPYLALEIAQKSHELAKSSNFIRGVIISETIIALVYTYKKEKDLALEHYVAGLLLAKKSGRVQSESDILNNIGNLYIQYEEYAMAMEYYTQSLDIKKRINDLRGTAVTLGN
ncbi:MAG: tetratricopeptide repeat protein, partial [Bacteroidota bacterium]